MRRVSILLLLFFCYFRMVRAQSDDITLMGQVTPVYSLGSPFSEKVVTSRREVLTVHISDIAVGSEQVLVRFYAADLPESWKTKVTDPQRLYGSYLPIAELVPGDASILTPSSASRFSLLEYNSRLIIGGLLVFQTDKTPQAFFLNFNQLPFDTEPLSEGFTKEVRLGPARPAAGSGAKADLSDIHDGLEFTLSATAQTAEASMLQPAVRMERDDEILSKFGWITISDTQNEKRFAVTRDNLYGFNLSDDSTYAPAHAYIFSPLYTDDPVQISMDHAFIVRSYADPEEILIRPDAQTPRLILDDEEIKLRLTGVRRMPDEEKVRLYIDSDGPETEDLSFRFETLGGTTEPPVYCGIDADTDQFACDIYFHEHSFPASELRFRIEAVEYRKDGPWDLVWDPVPMEKTGAADDTPAFPVINRFTERYRPEKEQHPEIQHVLDRMEERSRLLTEGEGWIREETESRYQFAPDSRQELIPVSQISSYLTHYRTDTWYHISREGTVSEKISLIYDAVTGELRSASLQNDGETLDLLHALKSRNETAFDTHYGCYREFREIAGSSASFISADPCLRDGQEDLCFDFSQSLNGIPDSPERQMITFQIDPDSGIIRNETVIYGENALKLERSFTVPEKTDALPDSIFELMDSIE